MFHMPFRNKCGPIALDVGTDSVKMLQLAAVAGRLAVRACGRWKIPVSVRTDPARRDELIIEAVKNMLKTGAFHGRKVVTALRCSSLSIRNIRVPRMSDSELAEAVKWEAAERFNFDVSPDRVRHLRAGEVREGNEVQDEVIMIAVDQQTIDRQMDMLQQIGLYPLYLGIEPVELFRIFGRRLRRAADKDAVSVVLDIGYQSTRAVVARGGRIVFIKSIDIAGERLAEAAAKQLNLTVAEADHLRSLVMKAHAESGGGGDGKDGGEKANLPQSVRWTVHDAVRGELESLAREVSLCLRYCAVTFRGLRPRGIIITGGQTYDPSVVKLLGDRLGIDCRIGQPLQDIDVSMVSKQMNRRGSLAEWALCAGLAVKDMVEQDIADELGDNRNRLSA